MTTGLTVSALSSVSTEWCELTNIAKRKSELHKLIKSNAEIDKSISSYLLSSHDNEYKNAGNVFALYCILYIVLDGALWYLKLLLTETLPSAT